MTSNQVYWARPEHPHDPDTHEPITDHLSAVTNHVLANTPQETTLSTGIPTRDVLYVLAWTHDIGKLTTWWQETHENDTVPAINQPPGNVENHSPLGAALTWWILTELGYDTHTTLAATIAVARHHSTIPNLNEYVESNLTDENRWETISAQADNINSQSESAKIASQIVTHLTTKKALYADSHPESEPTQNSLTWGDFHAAIGDLQADISNTIFGLLGVSLDDKHQDTTMYHDILELYGGLKGADTPASVGLSPARQSLPPADIVDEYIKKEFDVPPKNQTESLTDQLNLKRNQTRLETVDNITTQQATAGIFPITLPTGSGKTLTGTQVALKLAETRANSGPLLHILPYTAIIDQTKGVYDDLFSATNQDDTSKSPPIIAVDHYLADNGSDGDDTQPTPPSDKKQTLSEQAYKSWHADITLSTTVQLWESIYGPQKSQATKLPQLYNSTIIIDEPQTTPSDWWTRVERLLSVLVDVFDATVIPMSATHPPMDYPDPQDESQTTSTLTPEIDLPPRVTITLDNSLTETTKSPTEAAQHIYNEVKSNTNSILSIHNTVSNTRSVADKTLTKVNSDSELSVVNVFDIYQETINEGTSQDVDIPDVQNTQSMDNDIVYQDLPDPHTVTERIIQHPADIAILSLTTRIRPCDRQLLLAVVEELLDVQHDPPNRDEIDATIPDLIAITTQLVEAGVDISFESLYRDIAPYDSLIQAAGRCNRNYEHGEGGGSVTIWELQTESHSSSKTPAEYVYNQSGINELKKTRDQLLMCGEVGITVSQDCIMNQYTKYKNSIASEIPNRTPNAELENVMGEKITNLSLIPDDYPTISVYIPQSQTDRDLINAYREAISTGNIPREIQIRDCLQHIACDIPITDENPITTAGEEISEAEHILPQRVVSKLYDWKGIVNESPGIEHRIL